jgi:GT2 family glycosyltransferase
MVCVVDNASTDESLERLEASDDVRVYAAKTNLGFGRAVNYGARTSTAEFIIVLNNDMEAEPTFVEEMVGELQRCKRCALAAVQLRPDGLIDTLGVTVDQSLIAYDVGRGLEQDESADAFRPIGPSGGAAGFRREEFLEVGGYDESIFAYLEDVDLAIRLRAVGVEYGLARHARVWHLHSATLGSGSRQKNYLMGWSRGYLIWKYRASLTVRARIRGAIIDAVTYVGQIALDRNAGALRGRVAAVRVLKSTPPGSLYDLSGNEILTVREALRRKFRRGRGKRVREA